MTMVARVPTTAADRATACAWLPEENATTPLARSAFGMENRKLAAPRILNDPVVCRFSHLKKHWQLAISSSSREVSTGVRLASGRIRSDAARMSASCTTSVACLFVDDVLERLARREPAVVG